MGYPVTFRCGSMESGIPSPDLAYTVRFQRRQFQIQDARQGRIKQGER